MSVVRNQPVNTNFLQTTQFMLNFAKVPDTNYFCQTVTLPGINMSEVLQPTPMVDLYRPGDKLQYDPLVLTFIVDEWLNSWKNIHDWMRGLTYPTKFREYEKQKKEGLVSDASITVLNGLNNPVVRYMFKDCFPTSLSPLTMTATDDGGITITADVTIRYNWFDIVPVHGTT